MAGKGGNGGGGGNGNGNGDGGGCDDSSTVVCGHQRRDEDGNGFTDEGAVVSGHYTSLYAYDANGDWYLDYGDGRPGNPFGTVESVDDLDRSTLTTCDYVVNYRGDFGNDPSLDSGWIQNHINCRGYDDDRTFNVLYVHESDPRYSPDRPSVWGDWCYFVDTVSGLGNTVHTRPHSHQD